MFYGMRQQQRMYGDREKIREDNKERKQELIKRVREKRVGKAPVVPVGDGSPKVATKRVEPNYKRLYKDLKKNYSKLEKRAGESVKKFEKQVVSTQSVECKVKDLRKYVAELEAKNRELTKQVEERDKVIQQKTDELRELRIDRDVAVRQKKWVTEHKERLEAKLTNVSRTRDNLKKMYEQDFTIPMNELKGQLQEARLQVSGLNKKVTELMQEVAGYRGDDISKLIEILDENLTVDNFYMYKGVEQLAHKVRSRKELFYRLRKQDVADEVEFESFTDSGFIVQDGGQDFFRSVTGTRRRINGCVGYHYEDGDPCVGLVNEDGSIYIHSFYKTEYEMRNARSKSTSKSNKGLSKSKKDYDYIGDFSVLVVSVPKVGKRYRSRLQLHGMAADWIDAYEKSPVHVRGEMRKYDVVLLCTDCIPHTVTMGLDKSATNFEYVTDDTEDKMVEKACEVARRLGLLGSSG
ncbi:MAG: hypothetical protein ACI35P_15060 [Bacillus sp. (in: firmicutes)]